MSSILWSDGGEKNDERLVQFLVKKIVVGNETHYENCVNKILTHIRTEDWQHKYPNRTFVFSIYYSLAIKGVIEISLSLHTQALELIYLHLSEAEGRYHAKASFAEKFQYVFKEAYEWDLPSETAEVTRILRNDVAHTGSILGVEHVSHSGDSDRLERYIMDRFNRSEQKITVVQGRMQIAGKFNYLMEDILIRILGLGQNDLSRNLTPAWRDAVFGYDHENRPSWLRT